MKKYIYIILGLVTASSSFGYAEFGNIMNDTPPFHVSYLDEFSYNAECIISGPSHVLFSMVQDFHFDKKLHGSQEDIKNFCQTPFPIHMLIKNEQGDAFYVQASYMPQSQKCETISRGFPISMKFLNTSLLFPGNTLGLLALDKNYKLVLTPDVSTTPLTTDVEDYIGRLRECKPNIRLKKTQ